MPETSDMPFPSLPILTIVTVTLSQPPLKAFAECGTDRFTCLSEDILLKDRQTNVL